MRAIIIIILMASAFLTVTAQNKTVSEKEIIQLSKDKWQWMADKDVAKLEPLFHNDSRFVHMSGTWGKVKELEIIKTGVFGTKKQKFMMSLLNHSVIIPLLYGIESPLQPM